jgi:protein-S-isoprenylcysteine O-methyltransferase Ste14
MNWNRIARRVRVPLGFLLAGFYAWLARPVLWSILGGAVVAAAGLAIRACASGTVRKNEELATTGPYAHTRNPLYLGSIIIAAGFAVAAQRWIILAVLLVMFVAIYLPVIRAEEKFLWERFPEFVEYERRVPRLIPRLSTLFSPDAGSEGRFSWDLYRKHREYNALAGALGMMALLLVKLFWFTR